MPYALSRLFTPHLTSRLKPMPWQVLDIMKKGQIMVESEPILNIPQVELKCKLKCLDKRIDKFETKLIEWKLLHVDDDEKPFLKVVSTVNADSDSEVEEVFDEHTTFMASTDLKHGSDSCYGTNSLWEQWKKTKRDDDYDAYDVNLYDNHDMFDNLRTICDEFDIMVIYSF
ncbi:hypothetical protein Tco_0957266 [Tanacetum coccineum]